MEFSVRLNALMNLMGVSNSKLARHLQVDPSLISRWRNGSRRPTKDQKTIQKISAYLISQIATNYHLRELAELTNSPEIINMKESDVVERVFLWLRAIDDSPAPKLAERAAKLRESIVLETTDDYVGTSGRSLVLRKLLESFDSDTPNTTVCFYSNDPIDLLTQDIAVGAEAVLERPGFFDNIGDIKLIINDNATAREIEAYLTFLLPLLVKGRLHIVQSPHYRKEAFSNSMLILGNSLSAASHGFTGGSAYMTSLYTKSSFISQLTNDFLRVFEQGTSLHTTNWDINFFEILDDSLKFWVNDKPMSYVSNALPICSADASIALSLTRRAGLLRVDNEAETMSAIRDYYIRYEQYLEKQKNYLFMPLFTLEEVHAGAASMTGLPRFKDVFPLINGSSYLAILNCVLDRLERLENLILKVVSETKHEYSLRFQVGSHSSILKNTTPYANYVSTHPAFTNGIASFISKTYGDDKALEAERSSNIEILRQHIAEYELSLAQEHARSEIA